MVLRSVVSKELLLMYTLKAVALDMAGWRWSRTHLLSDTPNNTLSVCPFAV